MTLGRVPAECFPPASFILDGLDERGWTREDLISHVKPTRARMDVQDVLDAKRVTPRAALALSRVFGTSAQLWLNLDASWWEWLMRQLEKQAVNDKDHQGKESTA